ncbi:MAG: exodeoxyribonuclease VII small subunit [Clostridia bacterium]|nr:exodeoxyribonuclease VII small subunit [Clostridia bacterium]
MEEKKLTFEDGMKRLEEIVVGLERGSVSLEEAMDLFTEGTKLSKELQLILDRAESKIKMITEQNGQVTAVDFENKETAE